MRATVSRLLRYPVKSMQGHDVTDLGVGPEGIEGDRAWGVLDRTTEKVASAKRVPALLDATGEDDTAVLPHGERVDLRADDAAARLSAWLGRDVRPIRAGAASGLSYQMTFNPPDDDAEVFDIPVPEGTLLDLAAVHVVFSPTLVHCARQRPDLDWDVRRFRPNIVVEADTEPFEEDSWGGRRLVVGGSTLQVIGPTVRCAMPLRAQPGGLERQPGLTRALSELNAAFPNHLGTYLSVVDPGPVAVGDDVELA